jgi:hypothetical protein
LSCLSHDTALPSPALTLGDESAATNAPLRSCSASGSGWRHCRLRARCGVMRMRCSCCRHAASSVCLPMCEIPSSRHTHTAPCVLTYAGASCQRPRASVPQLTSLMVSWGAVEGCSSLDRWVVLFCVPRVSVKDAGNTQIGRIVGNARDHS